MANDPMIHWEVASRFGIQVDEAADAWHSGHVTEVLEFEDGNALVVATETGGVWMLTPSNLPLQLSDNWDDPDSTCIALGPDDPRHVLAGCTAQYPPESLRSRPTIMESQPGSGGLLNWAPVADALPARAGSITRLLVIPQLRLLVVACKKLLAEDEGGIFWASIPPASFGSPPPARPRYAWKRAIVADEPGDGFYDLAIGSTVREKNRNELDNLGEITIVAGAKSGGIFVGQWSNQELRMGRAIQMSGTVVVSGLESAGACSVASCDSQPNIVYAACAKTDGRLMQVLRSEDGGRTWLLRGSSIQGSDLFGSLLVEAGAQGNDWNNRIAVAPYDPNLVALGWQSGPFLSLDGCANWQTIAASPHLHSDTHALLFSALTPSGNRTLYIGSDGGLASVDLDQLLNGGPNPFRSDYNRELPTLQCYSALIRQFYGTLDGSIEEPGLVAAGLQDNGNAYIRLNPGTAPWARIEWGDGGWNAFLSDGSLGHNVKGLRFQVASFDDPSKLSNVDVEVTMPPAPGGLSGPVAEAVVDPIHRNASGRLLTAMAAVANKVYGLYIDDVDAPRYGWELLCTLPDDAAVGALGSFHGGTVFAGTLTDGRMFAIDVTQGSALQLPVVLPKSTPGTPMGGGSFIRIVAFSESDVFAVLDGASEQGVPTGVTPLSHSYVMRLDTLRWTPTTSLGLPGEPMYGLAAVPPADNGVNRALVVSTDDAVYVSRDDGASWGRASAGLPRRAHCGDLRCGADRRGGIHLYLGTYGRSVWVAQLRPTPE